MPVFKNLLSEKNWNKVINTYMKRVKGISSICNDVIKSSCLIDIIICSYRNDGLSKAYQDTIIAINNEINKALAYCKLHPKFTNSVNDIIKKTLVEMDNDIFNPNSAFKNWINELFVFNLLAKWDDYDIVDLERSLGNGKTCDFVCRNRNGQEIWFEVITLQQIDSSKQDDNNSMNDYLNKRITDKYNMKTEGLKDIPNIKILPIIEYVDGLEKFSVSVNSDIAIEPLTIMKNNLNGISTVELRPLNFYLSQIRIQKRYLSQP